LLSNSFENRPFPQPVEPGKIPEGAGGFNPLKESESAVPSGSGLRRIIENH
jgi:hypothetical protein